MAKRVESFQADCLDGGSTPPSSTREKDQLLLVFFSCGAYAQPLYSSLNPSFGKGGTWSKMNTSLIIQIVGLFLLWSIRSTLTLTTTHFQQIVSTKTDRFFGVEIWGLFARRAENKNSTRSNSFESECYFCFPHYSI